MRKRLARSPESSKSSRGSLSFQVILLVLTAAAPRGAGGSEDGDPAPGRSPGPPLESNRISGKNSEMFDDFKKKSNESFWCESEFGPANGLRLNITFRHPLFAVSDVLLPGILYQAHVEERRHEEGSLEEVFASSTLNGLPVGSWSNESSARTCSDGDWVAVKLGKPLGWSFLIAEPSNITFRFRYRMTSGEIHEENFSYSAVTDCVIKLGPPKGTFGSADLPALGTCRVIFPQKSTPSLPFSFDRRDGLLVELTRLNVPCSGGGYIRFLEEDRNDLEEPFLTVPKKLCGKLEELNAAERKLYFPSLSDSVRPSLLLHNHPVFSLTYRLVDYCYNVTFVSRNGSLALDPVRDLLCHFRVHLPYGNRVLLRLLVGEDRPTSSTTTTTTTSASQTYEERPGEECEGLLAIVWDGRLTWSHCSRPGDPKRDVQVWSRDNVVTIKVVVRGAGGEGAGLPVARFWYHAEPVPEIVGACDFGEVLVKQFCVSSVKVPLNWENAEKFCRRRGGHLASIRDENSRNAVDNFLLNSPDYKEQNSYWIGASDKTQEGHFRWSDGYAFSYSNWFPGWPQQSFYNRQPNDDGFSHQDCVEIRRVFPHPSGSRIIDGVASSYFWNDLDCAVPNFFLCERLENGAFAICGEAQLVTVKDANKESTPAFHWHRNEFNLGESSEGSGSQECNKTVSLSREHPKATVASPGFPHPYPDNVRCETLVSAPSAFRLVVDFEELVLEKEPSCSYDYLELAESPHDDGRVARRMCGDMSDKLKLLRYISQGPELKFVFVSDYSHHYGGFKARVSIESARMECSDERFQMFNRSCYLIVGYPKVTWGTARQICAGMKAELATVLNAEEESFVTGNIRKSPEYTTSSAYWLAGFLETPGTWKWADGTPVDYAAWASVEDSEASAKSEEDLCLAVRWVSSEAEQGHPASGLYWTPQQCKRTGGYVCKKGNRVSGTVLDLNRTINGTQGHLTSPGYPSPYYHDLDYYVHLVGPLWTRMVVIFTKLDLEHQAECLYDYMELRSGGSVEPGARWCGNKATRKNRSRFVSDDNEAILRFHSDYSVAGSGFYANWKAVDVTGCPSQRLTAREGIISSPNYGEFLLPRLDCTTIILAPHGKRIWMEFTDVNLEREGKEKEASVELNLGEGHEPFLLLPGHDVAGGNFLSGAEKMAVRLTTSNNPQGHGFRAVYRTVSSVEEEEVVDLSPDTNGILHHLNYPAAPPQHVDFVQHLIAPIGFIICLELQEMTLVETGKFCPEGRGTIEISDNYADVNGSWWFLCEVESNPFYPAPPFAIASYLNSLHVRQRTSAVGARMNASIKVKPDPNFKLKLLRGSEDGNVESCRPNPCQNGGKCLTSEGRKQCQCIGHFTGMFCALTFCELEPCLFGQCELTGSGFRCRCQAGYAGPSCDRKQSPCEENPCEGRGECVERGDSFHCRCHAWWEGPRCEKRMVHIPFKPLSERMLQEPFWLGLITVFVVLGIIGIVWCAKRHFPEKLEKLLAEEADRHSRSNVSGIIRPPSVREQIHAASGAVAVSNPPATAGCPRTLFSRLGIRKSSLLSLTSSQCPDAATSRTFSFDDLLRPPPTRTPSPRKKSGNAAPAKRNPAEKKQILQQLICSSAAQLQPRNVNPNEIIGLREGKKKTVAVEKVDWRETAFSAPVAKVDSKTDLSKLEKKVTFARLLSKVSAEMSSGSEAETPNSGFLKTLSTPASPVLERKSPPGSNRGSDSLSSSEIAISGSAFNSMLDIPTDAKRPTRLTYAGAKNASADSILEMFRSFTTTSITRMGGPSPSTTPSSPQEERGVSDESSPLETPISTTSGAVDSPTARNATIEIPVVDALAAQKSGSNFLLPPAILLEVPAGGINKCLSPIREVPTPMSSPALTPVMTRTEHEPGKIFEESSEDEIGSEDFAEVLIHVHREDESPPAGAGEFVHQAFSPDSPSGKVVPLLTVQEPSPPSTSPPGSPGFPGSPPPQKGSGSFAFSSRRLEKPNSLDLPYPPPVITVTCNVSEPESDTESMSAPKNQSNNGTENSGGMTYLSPFSMCSRADRTASESNLSSSGYSSMASPGPSRCGSNNPLCLSEVEDQNQSQSQPPSRRPSPLLRTPACDGRQPEEGKRVRGRSDSETLSDDPLVESNDEGIGTDHLDEKIEDGEVKSARELEIFMGKELNGQNVIDFSALIIPTPPQRGLFKKCDNLDCSKTSLQLPTIVVQSDYCDKVLSPVSSRSESPLSDKALGFGRISPMFYGNHFLFTDSDGMYDFPSSDCPPSNNKAVQAGTIPHRKSTGRRRERRSGRLAACSSKNSSPTKGQNGLLEVPAKEAPGRQRKPSPKRRTRTQPPLSSSSSTESLNSGDNWRDRTESESPAEHASEDNFRAAAELRKGEPLPQKKLLGFRTIGHQIRFLRRIEMSLKRKEKMVDSEDEEDTDDPSLSLLPEGNKKTGGIGILRQSTTPKQRGTKKHSAVVLPPRVLPKQDVLVARGPAD